MENRFILPALPRHKRKCNDSNSAIELLHGVSISPTIKKLRQEFGSTSQELFPNSCGFVPATEIGLPAYASNVVGNVPVASIDIDLSGESLDSELPLSLNDERAIVLYKPVTPPLFPGGPSAGSQVLLDARILPAGVLNASNLCGKKEDELSWLSARITGVTTELSEEEDKCPNVLHHNHLAVVPWDSKSPVNVLTSQTAGHPSNATIGGVVAMEEDENLNMDFVDSQPSSAAASFFYEPWQQYGVPQLQFGPLMWSH